MARAGRFGPDGGLPSRGLIAGPIDLCTVYRQFILAIQFCAAAELLAERTGLCIFSAYSRAGKH
jgi:hypothetical protein